MTGSRYHADDRPICPGCDAQLPASLWCADCQTYPSDWSQVTLTEWNERNPEVVREIKAWLNTPPRKRPDGRWEIAA